MFLQDSVRVPYEFEQFRTATSVLFNCDGIPTLLVYENVFCCQCCPTLFAAADMTFSSSERGFCICRGLGTSMCWNTLLGSSPQRDEMSFVQASAASLCAVCSTTTGCRKAKQGLGDFISSSRPPFRPSFRVSACVCRRHRLLNKFPCFQDARIVIQPDLLWRLDWPQYAHEDEALRKA
jgi:hypothetical protein